MLSAPKLMLSFVLAEDREYAPSVRLFVIGVRLTGAGFALEYVYPGSYVVPERFREEVSQGERGERLFLSTASQARGFPGSCDGPTGGTGYDTPSPSLFRSEEVRVDGTRSIRGDQLPLPKCVPEFGVDRYDGGAAPFATDSRGSIPIWPPDQEGRLGRFVPFGCVRRALGEPNVLGSQITEFPNAHPGFRQKQQYRSLEWMRRGFENRPELSDCGDPSTFLSPGSPGVVRQIALPVGTPVARLTERYEITLPVGPAPAKRDDVMNLELRFAPTVATSPLVAGENDLSEPFPVCLRQPFDHRLASVSQAV